MRIGLLSTWASRLGGGVFEAVVAQAKMIADGGDEPTLFALEDEHSAADRARLPGVVTVARVVGPRAVGFAPGLVPALLAADLDILHLHGIWMYPSLAGAVWQEKTDKPYLISPHGMLDTWIVSRGRAKKALARVGYERRSWRRAALLHALTEAEARNIRTETGRDAVVVPNAVPHAPDDVAVAPLAEPYLLSIGRIHRKKNINGLIDGWLASRGPARGWTLAIVGWGEPGQVAALEARLREPGTASIRFLGPAYGGTKAALLSGARFAVQPSFSEGLPVAVLEAWAAGTPTIMSAGCNLPEGFAAGAALETGTDSAAIAAVLDRALDLSPIEQALMSARARELVGTYFSPAVIGHRWTEIYQGLHSRGSPL